MMLMMMMMMMMSLLLLLHHQKNPQNQSQSQQREEEEREVTLERNLRESQLVVVNQQKNPGDLVDVMILTPQQLWILHSWDMILVFVTFHQVYIICIQSLSSCHFTECVIVLESLLATEV